MDVFAQLTMVYHIPMVLHVGHPDEVSVEA